MKSTAAAIIAIVESPRFGDHVWRPGIVRPPIVFSERITHANAVSVKTTPVTFSPLLGAPRARRSPSMISAALPARSPGG